MEPPGEKSVFILQPTEAPVTRLPDGKAPASSEASFPETVLIQNIRVFCRFRWIVIAVLAMLGVVAAIPQAVDALGLWPNMIWPFVLAVILLIENLIFLTHYRYILRAGKPGARVSLWGQIIVDLLVLTVVVHFCGSGQTVVHFAYLFHIVLTCIFFPRRSSLIVTLLACGLYGGCLLVKATSLLPDAGLFNKTGHESIAANLNIFNFLMSMVFMAVIWYLASVLSTMVRRRDRRLADTNEQLIAAREDRRKHMLQTTHELKAPFAAIDANTQLLTRGYCGQLPEQAANTVDRIRARSKRLALQIQELLQLSNLDSRARQQIDPVELDLADVLTWCIEQARDKAGTRNVAIETAIEPVTVRATDEHLKMLLGNLVINAVLYSYEGGTVRVTCHEGGDRIAHVAVSDDGIGISPDKLPRIFDEHYRTAEAVSHNKESTGLGLAIVRRIARLHGLTVTVTSTVGQGTTFDVAIPVTRTPSGESTWPTS